jgi:apolipoprotein N-acyltransferase
MSEKNSFEQILKWVVVAILAIAALKIALTVLGIAFVLGGFLLFRVLPIVLVIWLAFKAIEWLRGERGGSASTLDV